MGNKIVIDYNKIYTISKILELLSYHNDISCNSYSNAFTEQLLEDLNYQNENSLKIFICDDNINFENFYVAEIYLKKTNNCLSVAIVKYHKKCNHRKMCVLNYFTPNHKKRYNDTTFREISYDLFEIANIIRNIDIRTINSLSNRAISQNDKNIINNYNKLYNAQNVLI